MISRICELLTKHRFSKLEGYTDILEDGQREYYYRCKVCGLSFWNYNKPKDLIIEGEDDIDE